MSAAGLSVFDLDHTLIHKNISFAFGGFLYKKGQLSFRDALGCVTSYLRHRILSPSLNTMHHKVIGRLKGRSLETMMGLVEEFLDLYLESMLYRPAIDQLEEAKELGHHTLLLSGSPDFLVEPVAKRLGVHDWGGTHYIVDKEKRLSAIGCVLGGVQKAARVLELTKAMKLAKGAVHAFSDSIFDLPLLEVAGRAVGVRPGKKLRKECNKRGWRIIE